MNRSIVVVMLAILISGLAQAQTETQVQPQPQTGEERQFHIYVVAGLARATGGDSRFEMGGGAEYFVYKGLSASGEYARIKGSDTTGGSNNISLNGTYHFLGRGKSQKFDPFATGGYSRFFASGVGANAMNLGGGMNYWLSEGLGLRFDLRDYEVRGPGRLIGLRGGVVLGF
jgi:hypothetical protein